QSVKLWVPRGEQTTPRKVIELPKKTVFALSFSPDDKTLAAGCDDGSVFLWDADGKAKQQWRQSGLVRSVTFTADGRHLAIGNSNGTVYILRL
ncbi:hypothetical protein NL529_27790, partial [Klebsiella pneumoniae]|nr:hypothetical protein [Klebsiella pneumoniae]